MVAYSVYIHIPFCKRKCDYCHFYVTRTSKNREALLLKALKQDWERNAPAGTLTTVYFGGGTPSQADPQTLAEILSWLPLSSCDEITLEANPDDITEPYARAIHSLGINRISLGVQTLSDALLKAIGRTHSAQRATAAAHTLADAGFTNISLDLMLDLPNQTLADIQATNAHITTLPITHVSLYNLVLEPPSAFYNRRTQIQHQMPNDETSLTMVSETISALETSNLKRYEISAFAKPGYESKHNTGYWKGRPFRGLGPSAFSYWEGKRFRNVCNLEEYARKLNQGESPIDFEETLSPERRWRELFVIGLRLINGIDLNELEGPMPDTLTLEPLLSDGLLAKQGTRYSLTDRGRLFYDTVASELVL